MSCLLLLLRRFNFLAFVTCSNCNNFSAHWIDNSNPKVCTGIVRKVPIPWRELHISSPQIRNSMRVQSKCSSTSIWVYGQWLHYGNWLEFERYGYFWVPIWGHHYQVEVDLYPTHYMLCTSPLFSKSQCKSTKDTRMPYIGLGVASLTTPWHIKRAMLAHEEKSHVLIEFTIKSQWLSYKL